MVEPDVVDSLLDDVDNCQLATDSDQEPQNKQQIKPYRRAAPDVENVKVFIHGHMRGLLSDVVDVQPVNITYLQ